VTGLPLPRAATAAQLKQKLLDAGVLSDPEKTIVAFESPEAAYAEAISKAGENDRIVVFGSFLTVAGAMRARRTALH
jgi:dihydrofolate synthase/folylpolyglutamate synthase